MKRIGEIFCYSIFFSIIFFLDRITKIWALRYLNIELIYNNYISFDFVINRGISWGMFHSQNEGMFFLVTVTIVSVTMLLASFAYHRFVYEQKLIIGELFIVTGALSNILDRLLYYGVIDFIKLSWGSWEFPIFNIADASITAGVFIMFISVYRDSQ